MLRNFHRNPLQQPQPTLATRPTRRKPRRCAKGATRVAMAT